MILKKEKGRFWKLERKKERKQGGDLVAKIEMKMVVA